MIKLGTIGTSGICEEFIAAMAKTCEFELAAVYSRTKEAGENFAKKYGCSKVFTSLTQMAQWEGIDAVYIASPNVCHAGQSRIFLENNKHVICEKPITTNAREYIELKKLADSKGLIYMEAIMSRHAEHYEKIKKALGKIGKIKSAKIDFSQRSSRLDRFLNGEKVNIFDMSLHAGTLMDLGVYCIYAAVDFFGKPKGIEAEARYLQNGADGSGTAVFDYGDFKAELTYDKTLRGTAGSEIIGENGTLRIDSISQYKGVTLIKDGKEEAVAGCPEKTEVMKGEAQRFADFVLRFDENKVEYKKISDLCLCVHSCMDEIKNKAGIVYPAGKDEKI